MTGDIERETAVRLLRRLREARGWSWTDLARTLRDTARELHIPAVARVDVATIQRTLARWESLTETTVPGQRYQLLLAYMYARTKPGDVAIGPGSDLELLLTALRHYGVPARRIDEITALVINALNREGTRGTGVTSEPVPRATLARSAAPSQETWAGTSMMWADSLGDLTNRIVELGRAELQLRSTTPTSDVAVRQFALKWPAVPRAVSRVPETGRRIGSGELTRLRAIRVQLKDIDNAHGGGTAFPMAVVFLQREVTPLLCSRYSERTGRALWDASAEIMLDVGWMAYDAGDHELARRYFLMALQMCHSNGNRLLGGRVLSALCHQALHLDQVSLAVDFIRAARSGTRGAATPRAVAMFAAMEACAEARNGHGSAVTAALVDAENAMSQATSSDDDALWLDFDEGGLWGHAARAYRDLHQERNAVRYAREALAHCRPEHGRTRAQRHAILAVGELRLGHIDAAAHIGLQIVTDGWRLRSGHVDLEVAGLLRALAPMRTPVAEVFVEEARSLLEARAVADVSP